MSRGQLEESAKILRGFNAHDELPQLLALILADHVAAEGGEFYRDFFLGHGIARINVPKVVHGHAAETPTGRSVATGDGVLASRSISLRI